MTWENQGSDVWYREGSWEQACRRREAEYRRHDEQEKFYESNKKSVDEQLRRDEIDALYKKVETARQNLEDLASEVGGYETRVRARALCDELEEKLPPRDWNKGERLIPTWEMDKVPDNLKDKR